MLDLKYMDYKLKPHHIIILLILTIIAAKIIDIRWKQVEKERCKIWHYKDCYLIK